jgi:hypothetical protein
MPGVSWYDERIGIRPEADHLFYKMLMTGK